MGAAIMARAGVLAENPCDHRTGSRSTEKIKSMQALRGVAAWSVLFGHAVIFASVIAEDQGIISAVRPYTSAASHVGVDLFFVISGAIMFIIAHQPRGPNRVLEALDFAFRRVIRVFPLYWITLLAMASWWPTTAPATPWEWVRCLLLFEIPAAHPVAWTLFYEVRFYFMIAVAIFLFRASRTTGFLFWSAAMVAIAWMSMQQLIPWTTFTTTFFLEFIMGMGVGAAYVGRVQIWGTPLLLLAALVFVFTCFWLVQEPNRVNSLRMFGYGLPAALLLLVAMTWERDQSWVPNSDRLQFQGDASYSLYIWHFGILQFLTQIWPWRGTGTALVFIVVGCILCTAVAYLSYRVLERSLSDVIKAASRRYAPAASLAQNG
jgi:exopolysaccharide production protein ExoZ